MRVRKLPVRRAKKAKHPFLADRDMDGAWVVIRIDDLATTPAVRGQFYPSTVDHMRQGAVWPSEAKALQAAHWAATHYGNVYGVFRLTHITGQIKPPITTVPV